MCHHNTLAAHSCCQQAVFIQRWCPDRSGHELPLGRQEIYGLAILNSVSPGLKWLEAWVGFEPTSLCCEAKILLGTEQGLDALEVSCNGG